jgi:hypothetical protein
VAWIESHTVLMRHRKLAELARGLRIRRAHASGHLHSLWHAALEQQDDGDLTGWSDEFIAEMSDVPSDAPQFVRLLQTTGFLGYKDAEGNLIPGTERLIHDWPDYAGRFLMNRYASSNREKLVQIWAIHRRLYGRNCEQPESNLTATEKQPLSNNTNRTLPDQSDQPNQPTKKRRVRGGEPAPPVAAGLSIQAKIMEEVWKPRWAAAHRNEDYCPSRVDFVKLAEILSQLGVKKDENHAVERFKKIADTAFQQKEEFGWQGHKLTAVQKNLPWLISETAKKNGAHVRVKEQIYGEV